MGDSRSDVVGRLVSELADPLFNFGYRMCGNREDAEDLVQETFLSAWRAWSSFRGESSPKTWLYAIASRVCLHKRRRRSGEPKRFLSIEEVLPGPVSPRPLPSDLADRTATQDRVRRAILRLPPAYRTAVVLKDIQGLSLEEIARALKLKIPTVKTRIHRGRLALRKELLGEAHAKVPAPTVECLEALSRALEMLDSGKKPSPLHSCARCREVYRLLDLGRAACSALTGETLPPAARARLLRRLRKMTPMATEIARPEPARSRVPFAKTRS